MKFLIKLEDLANQALSWMLNQLVSLWQKACPSWLMRCWHHFKRILTIVFSTIVGLPQTVKDHTRKLKEAAPVVDYKSVFVLALDAGQKAYNNYKELSPLKACWRALCAPFAFLFDWAASLKPIHFVVLLSATIGGVIASIAIVVQVKQIIDRTDIFRAPASEPAEVAFERPEYYKKNEREISFNNVKIPVYLEGVNALRALIVDISVISSNRATKQWLESHEFPLRDHLVHELEPVTPTFPLSEEGTLVISEKIIAELNVFLKKYKVEGEVKEVRLVHKLAH